MAPSYGISPRTTPSMCPRCGTRVELSAHGNVAPHNIRVAGPSCDGSGLAVSAIPPWPAAVKMTKPVRLPKLRFNRPIRRTDTAAT